jgi:8-oxo-dGTP diphosphatase
MNTMHERPPTTDGSGIWKQLVTRALCPDEITYQRFLSRIEQGALTRDENPASHFCVYFLPINPQTKEVFIVHHKKSGLWLSPGGHLDANETPEQAVAREIVEELGVQNFFSQPPEPFFFSIVDIDQARHSCKTHYDLWYPMLTNGSTFHIDPVEFHSTKWMSIPDAQRIITDPSNLQALDRILHVH